MTSAYAFFLVERERKRLLLINAGLADDEADRIAHSSALDAAEKKFNTGGIIAVDGSATWEH